MNLWKIILKLDNSEISANNLKSPVDLFNNFDDTKNHTDLVFNPFDNSIKSQQSTERRKGNFYLLSIIYLKNGAKRRDCVCKFWIFLIFEEMKQFQVSVIQNNKLTLDFPLCLKNISHPPSIHKTEVFIEKVEKTKRMTKKKDSHIFEVL